MYKYNVNIKEIRSVLCRKNIMRLHPCMRYTWMQPQLITIFFIPLFPKYRHELPDSPLTVHLHRKTHVFRLERVLPQIRHNHSPAIGAAALHPGLPALGTDQAGRHGAHNSQGIMERTVTHAVVLGLVSPKIMDHGLPHIIHCRTPASPALLLAVQTAVYTVYSLASLVLVYAAAVLFFGARFPGSAVAYLAVFLFVMLVIFSIGMMIGGIAPDVRTAGMWASILYFPMLVLSGATLPYETMPSGLQRIADMMPLTQGIKLLKAVSLGLPAEGIWKSCLYMAVCFLVCGGIALRYFKWE